MLQPLRAASLALALGLFLASAPARAWEPGPWTTADTWWEVAFATAVALDCRQSVQLEQDGRYERNPVLPHHPNARTMKVICLGSVVGHLAVSLALPTQVRRSWQAVTVVLEAATVTDNYFRAGLRIRF
jgi:hypothetical protein